VPLQPRKQVILAIANGEKLPYDPDVNISIDNDPTNTPLTDERRLQ